MTITYTGNLKLALPTTGTEAGTWGDVVNQQITALLDQSVSGTVSLTSMTNADYTLTNGNGSSPNEARYMALSVPSTLTLTAARNIIVPTSSKAYIIRNLTTGGFAVTLKTSAGTGISVPNGKTMILYCDGTNVIDGTDYFTSIATGNLSYTGTLTGGTGIVNIGSGQVYKDASGNVGIGTSSPGAKLDVQGGALRLNLQSTNNGGYATWKYVGKTSTGTAVNFEQGINIAADNAFELYDNQNAYLASRYISGVSGYWSWFTQGSERMRLDASGNLGLGRPTNTNYRMIIRGQGTTSATAGLVVENSVGTEYFYLNDAGNLGLGVTPSAWSAGYKSLDIGDTASFLNSTGSAFVGNNAYYSSGWKYKTSTAAIGTQLFGANPSGGGGYAWFQAPSGTAGNAITFSQAMTLDASGNLFSGGTTSAACRWRLSQPSGDGSIHVSGNGTNYGFLKAGAGHGSVDVGADSAVPLRFFTSNTERAQFDASGNLLVGTTNANAKITVYGVQANRTLLVRTNSSTATDVPLTAWNDAITGNNVFVNFGTEATYTDRGSIDYNRAGGLVRYNTTSDYRAKDIIGPVQNPGATIDALKVYEGVMKGATQSRPMLIAHEAQAHAPYAVSGTKDDVNEDGTPKYQQIDVSSLVPLLLAEIQSLRKRLAALEAK